jgi:hypothetical protein
MAQLLGREGPLPRASEIGGQPPGEAELGVGGKQQPDPAVGLGRAAQAGPGQPQGLLAKPEGVFKIKPAQEHPPQPVKVDCGGIRVAGPQPQRLGVAVAREVLDPNMDQRALHDRQLTIMVGPGCAPLQLGVQAVPAAGHDGAEAVVGGGGGLRGQRVGGRVGKAEGVP